MQLLTFVAVRLFFYIPVPGFKRQAENLELIFKKTKLVEHVPVSSLDLLESVAAEKDLDNVLHGRLVTDE